VPNRIVHLCLSVRGALMNWESYQWVGVVRDDSGRVLSPREFKEALLDELANGHEVIPYGTACEGFDYSGGGCPGHDVPDEIEGANSGPKLDRKVT
jgi:hypothetical protein